MADSNEHGVTVEKDSDTATGRAGAAGTEVAAGVKAGVESITGAPTTARRKHKRVVRRGGEKVLESEAVESFRLKDTTPHEPPQAQGGNDARLIADVPPHWGRQ